MEVAHGAARRRAGGLPASGGGVRALLVARPLVPHGVRPDETHDGDDGDVSISLKADTELYRSTTGEYLHTREYDTGGVPPHTKTSKSFPIFGNISASFYLDPYPSSF